MLVRREAWEEKHEKERGEAAGKALKRSDVSEMQGVFKTDFRFPLLCLSSIF